MASASGDDDDDAVETDDETTETTPVRRPATTAAEAEITGPAPGVTDDTIKIGVNYVDTASLTAVGLNFDLGDYQATYQALVDDINADGGINGRQARTVFAPIDPTGPASADAACLKLTEDDDVFLVTGFFLDRCGAVPGRHARDRGRRRRHDSGAARAGQGAVDHLDARHRPARARSSTRCSNGVNSTARSRCSPHAAGRRELMDDTVLPKLAELGIEPVETAIDRRAGSDDTAALQSNVTLIAENASRPRASTRW